MAEVSDITIKRTQDTLGKIIKKPVLSEKLLRKPPFKFLHDIINAVRVRIIGKCSNQLLTFLPFHSGYQNQWNFKWSV